MVNPTPSDAALSAFAVRASASSRIDLEEVNGLIIPRRDFLDHLNAVIYGPVLGRELRHEKLKEIVDGETEAILALLMAGADVKFGRLGIFRSRVLPAGPRRNPRTQEYIDHEIRQIDFDPSRRVKELLRQRRS